tara:strand:- start:110 stop:358 length:249 start_codon:yes stop_codon:yes gene_type:complete
MGLVYQSGNLTIISDPLDDLCDSVLIDYVEAYRKRQDDKWNTLTNTHVLEEEEPTNWRNIVSNSENTENNLIHSQFNFPSLS